jgi:hypothetical protein
MKKTSILILLLFVDFACKKNEANTETQNIESQIVTNYAIRPSQIYKAEILSGFATNTQADTLRLLLAEGKTFFEKAKSLEAENKQKAIHWYHRVLTCYPSAYTYSKLGDLLVAEHENQDAKLAYQTALLVLKNEQLSLISKKFDAALALQAPNMEELYSKTIKAAVLNQNFEEAVQILTENYELGFVSKDFVLNDVSLKTLRENSAFKLFYTLNLVSSEQKEQARRAYFLGQFAKAQLPYSLEPKAPSTDRYNYEYYEGFDNPILNKYEKEILADSMLYAKVTYLAHLKDSPNYSLLLATYDTTSFESVSEVFRTFNYILLSLDKKGNIADKMTVAYRTPFQESGCTITENGFEMKISERKWKQPDYYKARKNNEFLGLTLQATKNYTIDEQGKFVEKKE